VGRLHDCRPRARLPLGCGADRWGDAPPFHSPEERLEYSALPSCCGGAAERVDSSGRSVGHFAMMGAAVVSRGPPRIGLPWLMPLCALLLACHAMQAVVYALCWTCSWLLVGGGCGCLRVGSVGSAGAVQAAAVVWYECAGCLGAALSATCVVTGAASAAWGEHVCLTAFSAVGHPAVGPGLPAFECSSKRCGVCWPVADEIYTSCEVCRWALAIHARCVLLYKVL